MSFGRKPPIPTPTRLVAPPPPSSRPSRPGSGIIQGAFIGGRPHLPAGSPVQAKLQSPQGNLALPANFALPAGPGRPLPTEVLQRMGAHFKADFSGVRVHVSNQATALGARAFTCGETIVFAPGHYAPETQQGLQLLGHELAHVIQQPL